MWTTECDENNCCYQTKGRYIRVNRTNKVDMKVAQVFRARLKPRTKAMATHIPVAAQVNWRNWIAVIWLKMERVASPL